MGSRSDIPRLPLEGSIDLTYRCNNNCRHCWLWVPDNEKSKNGELSLSEIKDLVDQARSMGCRRWSISGGEPMLREDFVEIFDYITSKSMKYTLNTNGTLITPEIAQLMTRKGAKMIALYGATADVHDHVTRNPGSFEAAMQGFAYLKEAGAGFTVQIVPMRDNYHQYDAMVELAKSLSPNYRIGASWLYLTANGSEHRNREIIRQRLTPKEIVELDQPHHSDEPGETADASGCGRVSDVCFLFSACIKSRKDFHVDPYGQMSFCPFVKDPALQYNLRKGSFSEAWDSFIPSLAEKVRVESEYYEGCGSCELQSDCRCCPVYSYLEHRRFSAKVEYLCDIAKETRKFKEDWRMTHKRYYGVGGMTICVESDLPITENTFDKKLDVFRLDGPGEDNVRIHHHFSIPEINDKGLGKELYRRQPWAIYKNSDSWTYCGTHLPPNDNKYQRVAIFNNDHSIGEIYNEDDEFYKENNLTSLTIFPTDQILLAPLLANRQGLLMHSAGMVINGHGLLFAGHSEAGKSTTVTMLKDEGKILCDDRIIIRRHPEGFRIYGTWSHGTVADISPDSAPLRAIMLLEKSDENRLTPVKNRGEIIRTLPKYAIKSMGTADWWNTTLSLIEQIAREVPVYRLQLDKSGKVKDVIKELVQPPAGCDDEKLAGRCG